MTTNPTPDPITAEIAELVPLMEKAGIIPERVSPTKSKASWLYHSDWATVLIDDSDILHILRGTAENWLRGRGWNGIWPGSDHDREYEHDEREYGRWYSLPAALAAEIEKGVR